MRSDPAGLLIVDDDVQVLQVLVRFLELEALRADWTALPLWVGG
jgi:hypothetical protein